MRNAAPNPDDQINVLGTVESRITSLQETSSAIRISHGRNTLTTVPNLVDQDEGYDLFEEQGRVSPVEFPTSSAFRDFVVQMMRKRGSFMESVQVQTCPPWFGVTQRDTPPHLVTFGEYRDVLLNRCAEMIARRRREFVYFRSRHAMLESDNAATRKESASQPQESPQMTSTSSWQGSTAKRQDLSMLDGIASGQNDTATSEVQDPFIPPCAPPSPQDSSTTSSEGGELSDTGYFELPPPPRLEEWETEKACPYCCVVLPRETYMERERYKCWRRHLVEDMEPYICLFQHCDAAGMTYRTFAEWQRHLRRRHIGHWTCPMEHDDESDPTLDCFTYETERECENHLIYDHPELEYAEALGSLVEAAQHEVLSGQCFVCLKDFTQTTAMLDIQRHIARHLQTIFILALPWRDDIEPDDMVSSNRMNSSAGSDLQDTHDHEVGHLFETTEEERSQELTQGHANSTSTENHQFRSQLVELGTKQDSHSLVESWLARLGDRQSIEEASELDFISTHDHDTYFYHPDSHQNFGDHDAAVAASNESARDDSPHSG